jgi:hypothetical protein
MARKFQRGAPTNESGQRDRVARGMIAGPWRGSKEGEANNL